uniref:BTB domain-containing protein n=1 Tax=Aceria tosichella TaxID=561515 RepID=A0A6G1S8G1_9ACAR
MMQSLVSTSIKFNIGGRVFEIEKELLSRHAECLLAKCIEHGTSNAEIPVDRDPDHFETILQFMNDPESILFHRLSNIDLNISLEEAKFYGIKEMVAKCERELSLGGYDRMDTILDANELEQILESETRYVILVRELDITHDTTERLSNALLRANRDKCLFLGFIETHLLPETISSISTIFYRKGRQPEGFSRPSLFYFLVYAANMDKPDILQRHPGVKQVQ